MSLTILSHNPRRRDEPMMTLIAGQPKAAATVDQCEALWSTRSSSPGPRLCNQADGRTVAETWATKSQMTPQATAGCAKRGRGASSVSRMGISRVWQTPAAAGTLVGYQLSEEGCAIMADEMTEEAPAPTSTATTRQTEPAVIAGISSGEGEMVWSFEIVPVGGHQRLAAGNFNAPDIEAAQQHAQTVNEPHVSASADLDVRLLDGAGNEVWRGTYLGSQG